MRAARRGCLAAAGAMALLAALPARAVEAGDVGSDISPAETLLFLDDHMAGFAAGRRIDYRIEHRGATPPAEDERFTLTASGTAARRSLVLTDRRGDFALPGGAGATPNPMILFFLDREVAAMERATGGQRRHFNRLIRTALARGPEIGAGTLDIDGKPLATREIVIEPYRDDAQRARYPELARKRLRFVLADALPGRVVELHSELPATDGGSGAVDDVLRFAGAR
ncbi:hypothetical protein [Derxia lacustris]|uniref:hypothetical protein n=1 Tax=Derxia lacustris TaxID=764842 RepID=UPI00111BDD5C|nr:hypothetical protein [Derxia lacustris]